VNTSALTVNALGGNDTVTTIGTANGDTVIVDVKTMITEQVGNTMTLGMPVAQTEKVGLSTLQGNDTITVNIYDTVNAARVSRARDGAHPLPRRGGIARV